MTRHCIDPFNKDGTGHSAAWDYESYPACMSILNIKELNMSSNGDRAQLFEYAVLWQPKERTDSNGNDVTPASTILVQPTRVLVKNEGEAMITASRAIPEEYLGKLDEVELVVRPF